MKRYASHFLYMPEQGFLKQYVVEIEEACVTRFFPLTEEIESVEWMPGVIEISSEENKLRAYYIYPFDFTEMKPVAGTLRRLLL